MDCADYSTGSPTLWRYIDVPALLWLLANRSLHFSWPERFQDPFEGEFVRAFVDKMGAVQGDVADHNRRFFEQMRSCRCAVSCWHQHEHENALMWRAYSGSAGVAIKSSVHLLRSVLPMAINIENVKYVNFDEDDVEYGNLLDRLKYKRLEYSFEQEVRAILWAESLVLQGIDVYDLGSAGLAFPVDPSALISEIRLSPELSTWFLESLTTAVTGLGYSIPVRPSLAGGEPYRFFKHSSITALTPWDEVQRTTVPKYVFTIPDPETPEP